MSITSVSPVYGLGTRSDYLEFGVGMKKKNHLASGTDRLAPGFYCDAPSIGEFIQLGNRLAEQHGRRVKAHSYVLSFHPDELDVDDAADLRRAGDLGFLLAKKMRPHSPAMVVVHDDGKGGCAHAHITVLNHDTVTGKAPRDFRVHWQVKRANDALMREEGMQVIQPSDTRSRDSYWVKNRGDKAAFDQQLGDVITEAALDVAAVDMPTFVEACESRGVEVVLAEHRVRADGYRNKKAGDSAVGITYKMRDEVTPGKEPRMRRRKASALSPEFTAEGLTEAFEQKKIMKGQIHGNHGQTRTAASRAERTAADFGTVERFARPARRDRNESEGSRQHDQRVHAEHYQDMDRIGAAAAADAAAAALRRVREGILVGDVGDAGQHPAGDPGTPQPHEDRDAPQRSQRNRGRPVRARFDAERVGGDHWTDRGEFTLG